MQHTDHKKNKEKNTWAKPKKSLGQNFLKSQSALHDMVTSGNINSKECVLEIGPGRGALTEKLLETGAHVIAIEKDHELIPILSEKFKKEITAKQFKLIEGDALEFNFESHKLKTKTYKLIANIPYYITGAIIRKFLSEIKTQPQAIVLLVQKEVALRIVTRDAKESLLSLSVKAYGTPKFITKVPARYFSPAPKVDSAIIAITDISKKNFSKNSEASFFKLIHAGFSHKRKVLARNLEAFCADKTKISHAFSTLGLKNTVRAEEVPLEKWFALLSQLI